MPAELAGIFFQERCMARKPNYGYEKRQRELAKQAKKEEKRKRKEGETSDVENPADDSPQDEI